MSNEIEKIEQRFLEISGITIDISKFPLEESDMLQVETDKQKSDQFGEVFTPLWLVDEMLNQTSWNSEKITLDLCAGYGQFTLRMIRKYFETYKEFDLYKFLGDTHHMSELQLESCFKLYYIFGENINLHIGDSSLLALLEDNARGINFYSEVQNKWINITESFKNEYVNCFINKTKKYEDVNFEPFESFSTNDDFF